MAFTSVGSWIFSLSTGHARGHLQKETAQKDAPVVKIQPISVPAIPMEELIEITDNFGVNALIGEGSYGRVYYGLLKSGQAAALKYLDSTKQPDQEFLAQVGFSKNSFISRS